VFCGWAGSLALHRAADAVGLFVGERLLRAVRPSVRRADAVRTLRAGRRVSAGFSLSVPIGALRGHERAVRVMALVGGKAAVLPFNCRAKPQDFDC
jgi:hypothetical protein